MRKAYTINLVIFIATFLCFALILLTGTNESIFVMINSTAAWFSPFIWANITFLGDTLAACSVMLLFIRKRPDLVWAGGIATIFATLITNGLKLCLDIPRPAAVISRDQVHIIGNLLLTHSFPSGHTVTIFTLAGIMMFFLRSALSRICILILALLVGLSRIAVGAHWPADVMAGASLGIFFATAGVYSVKRLGWDRNRWIQLIACFILIITDIFLLLFYRSDYDQAIYLQRVIAISFLIIGIREFYFLLRDLGEQGKMN
jgi:membrane-associated phospholipid phosphatase